MSSLFFWFTKTSLSSMPTILKQSTIFVRKGKMWMSYLEVIYKKFIHKKERLRLSPLSLRAIFFTLTERLLNSWKEENFVPFSPFPEVVLYFLEWISVLSFRLQMTYELSHKVSSQRWSICGDTHFEAKDSWEREITRIQILAVLYTVESWEEQGLNT